MGTQSKYLDQLNCQVTEKMKEWYFAEANRRSTMYKRVPVSDVVREALQIFMEHKTPADKS